MRIGIIGGGISGLALANALMEKGQDVQLFEGSPRPGGKVGTKAVGGYLLETGPNGFLDNEPAMLELVERLGLTGKLRRAADTSKRRFLFSGGRVKEVATSPKFLTSDLLSLAGRLRLFAEPFSSRGPSGDESVAAFMRRHLGDEATDVLIDAVQSGIYAGDPNQLSISATFPKLKELERDYRSLVLGMFRSPRGRPRGSTLATFEGGLETLIAALAARLGERVRCGAQVASMAKRDGGWILEVDEGGAKRAVEVERAVLGVPAFAAAGLVRAFAPEAAAALERIPYAPVAVVHLGYERREVSNGPEGFGVLVPYREGRSVLGILYVSSFFPFRAPPDTHLLTVMLGGARHPEVLQKDAAELERLAVEEVKTVLGITARPTMTEVVKWERAIPQYVVGHLDRVAHAEATLGRFQGLYLSGNAYRGIGLNDCVRNAQALAERVAA